MTKQELAQQLHEQFPKYGDCLNSHIGPLVVSIQQELADDRYYDIKVTRCSHCGIPLKSEYL